MAILGILFTRELGRIGRDEALIGESGYTGCFAPIMVITG